VRGVVRAEWPIEDLDMFVPALAIAAACRDLPRICDEVQGTLIGPPRFRARGRFLVCEAPAIARLPLGGSR
jgi:hypothetical protein